MNALDDLVRICPPPGRPPSAVDWTTTEDTLGTALPADYKRLVETYGEGVFDDTIWLTSPTCTC
ncbi:hypothetical protein [Streptomyces sp. NPDC005573]|uniref:hypothetical protein n=1 Tax=Streptomyces sp. NPDC005573 TaxID=3156890 RepID=UPI0033AAA5D8